MIGRGGWLRGKRAGAADSEHGDVVSKEAAVYECDRETATDLDRIKENLMLQLTRPVMFRKTVDALLVEGFDTFMQTGTVGAIEKIKQAG